MSRTGRRTCRVLGPIVVVLAVLASAVPASAATDPTAQLTAGINDFRVEHGLPSLPAYSTDAEVRRVHEHLVATGQMHALFEESAAFYFGQGASDFGEVEAYVEGQGCSAGTLLQQWLGSDFHRGLLLTPDATHLAVAGTCTGADAWATGHVITIPVPDTSGDPAVSDGEPGDTDTEPPAAATESETVPPSDAGATEDSASSTSAASETDSSAPVESTSEGSQGASADTRLSTAVQDGVVSGTDEPELPSSSPGQDRGFEVPQTDEEIAGTHPSAGAVDGATRPSGAPEQAVRPAALPAATTPASPPTPSLPLAGAVAAALIPLGLFAVLLGRRRRRP